MIYPFFTFITRYRARYWARYRASTFAIIASLAIASTLTGCALGPDFETPNLEVPARWNDNTTFISPSEGQETEETDLSQWWTQFQDPVLNDLIATAASENLDVKTANARILQSRAIRRIARSDLYPSVNAAANYSKREPGSKYRQSQTGAIDPDLIFVDADSESYEIGFDAFWELDLFGRVRRSVEASQADLEASIHAERNILLSVTAEVASGYIALRGLQARTRVARDSLERLEKSADITSRRFGVGFSNALEVANVRSRVASTRAVLPALEAQTRTELYALSVLLGKNPDQLVALLEPPVNNLGVNTEARVPSAEVQLPEILPSELLRRRPDIAVAEAQLHAATARVGVSIAELFPRFSLGALLGIDGEKFDMLGHWDRHLLTYGASLTAPIFQGGALQGNVELQKALQDQAFQNYKKTVLVALQEVESALVSYEQDRIRASFLREAVVQSRAAVELSQHLYIEGIGEYADVLESERDLFTSEDALISTLQSASVNRIALLKALAGGWPESSTEEEVLSPEPIDSSTSRISEPWGNV